MEESIHQEDVTFMPKYYASNKRASEYTKQKLTELKREKGKSIITFGHIKISF